MEVFSKKITTKITITEEERNFLNKLYQTILDVCDETFNTEDEVFLNEVIEELIEKGSFTR